MNGPKIYFEIPIFGGISITQTIVSSFVVMVLLCCAGIILGRKLQKRPTRVQVVVEKLVGMLYDMVEAVPFFRLRFLDRYDRYPAFGDI